jgi:2-keto-4-pentenoate hydratase/2-oxohepta-3-ene-1,7-dioic acid hydratase in catechol pathway
MKVIAIGRNYAEHAKELNSPLPAEPVFFMKPDTAIVKGNKPFFLPDFSNEIHHEVEIVLKINRVGKNIGEQFAHRYFAEIGIGIDFTARDLQAKCKEKGLPWEIAKAFDNSAPVGDFIPKEELKDLKNINFRLDINGTTVQHGNTSDMIFDFDKLIHHVSKYVTIKIGDLIFTGTPAGVGPVKIGDHLQAYIGDRCLLDFFIK